MDKGLIIDTDIASAFAKIGRLNLLKDLFSKHLVFITPRIFEELSIPLDYGYKFPLDIFDSFDVLNPTGEENETYRKMLVVNRVLGKGELEAISICKMRGYVFSSMDTAALRFAVSLDVETLELHSILRALWKSGMMSKEEVKALIQELEEEDNTQIRDTHSIF